jgi:Ca2+/Na+ antiporter
MDIILTSVASSKIFNGLIMLLSNIGGRYIALDMPSNIEYMFTNYFFLRLIVMFSIFFMATRDIKISILLLLLFLIIIKFFINEKSTFCLYNQNSTLKKISDDEYLKAQLIIKKYNKENNIVA